MISLAELRTLLFTNDSIRQTIAKNTGWLFFGQITSRAARAAIVIYAARTLGVSSWGAFSYALGIVTFLTTFSDIGISALITRESTKSPVAKDRFLAAGFAAKLILLVFIGIALLIVFPLLASFAEAQRIMPILLFVFAFDTIRDLTAALARSLERMEIEAGITVFTNLAIVALGFILLWFSPTSISLAIAYAIGSGLGLTVGIYVLRSHFRHIISSFEPRLIKTVLTIAWPFGLASLMGTIMLNTDIVMLGLMRSAEEVGFYSAAQKIIYLLYILPSLVATATFPALARFAATDPAKAKLLIRRVMGVVLVIAVPLAILGTLFAPIIITTLFGDAYAPAIMAFRILAATLIIVFPSTLLSNAIFAFNAQRRFVTIMLVAATSNIVLNLLLIPRFGIEGAAIATLLSQLATNGLIWWTLQRLLKNVPNIST